MAPVNPLDPALFDKVAIALTYAKLYPSLVRDFMGKQDCLAVHAPGNIVSTVVGTPVIHTTIQGGSSIIAQSKKAAYMATLKIGDLDNLLSLTGVSE